MHSIDYSTIQLIPLLPLAGALINLLVGKRMGKSFAGVVACSAVALAMLLGWDTAARLWSMPDHQLFHATIFDGDWLRASELVASLSLHVTSGLMLDRLSGMMVLVITTVGTLIHIYSTAYMEDDEGYHRYFAYLNLFTGAMLVLVMGDSLPVTFVGWEGVGLSSYLLIGFWFSKEANAYAGRKAFVVNRIGDFGFLLGMFLIYTVTSSLSYDTISSSTALHALKQPFHWHATFATVAALCLFLGCTGKSAQLPLYIWLPDAMAGPTPVSALIHAATMVTAGVYMIARLHFIFEIDPFVLAIIASVGAVTALFAATMGITQKPIKKILAYSTISQLGFMFIGVGTRAYGAGLFHLVTHAFFKAGLFLGAGSIMHALGGEEDVMKMGGLKAKLPITRWTFLIYCLAIAGIVPFAGFFSKDAILGGAFTFDYENLRGWPHWLGHAIYGVGLVAALCTAFYMFRAYFLVFEGKYRGDHHTWEHAHESPSPMSVPLVVLAIGAVGLGFLGMPKIEALSSLESWNLVDQWLPHHLTAAHEPEGSTVMLLMLAATVVALIGIGAAWSFYKDGPSPTVTRLAEGWPRLYKLVLNKYYVDEIYDVLVVRPLRRLAWFLWKVIDAFVIDLVFVRGSAVVVDLVGRALRYLESGDAQRYVVGMVVGLAGIVFCATKLTACNASSFDVTVQGHKVVVSAGAANLGPTVSRPLDYTIDFGDGSQPVAQRAPTAEHVYASGGKKEITVTVDDPRWSTHSTRHRTVVLP